LPAYDKAGSKSSKLVVSKPTLSWAEIDGSKRRKE
jgi:hypothetical protein